MRSKSALLCLLSILTFLAVAADAKTLTVSVDELNVRGGPGRTYPVVELVRKTEQFEILNEKNGWYQINVEGTTGWVSGKAVKVEEISRGGVAQETPGTRSSLHLYDRTWAVVVGINQYRNLGRRGQLDYAVSDAKAMEKMLREELGFDNVKALYNRDANKNNILAALNTYLADTGKEDAVFVFFAGHGHTEPTSYGDLGYILPHDGSFKPGEMYRNISMEELRTVSKRLKAKHVFYMMDSCYSGQMLSRRRAGVARPDKQIDYERLLSLTSSSVRQVMTAGGKGETVLDGGPYGHSVFAGRLIEALRGKADMNEDGFITAVELELYVGDKVFEDSRRRDTPQNPQFGNLFGGEGRFVFRTKRADQKMASHVEPRTVLMRTEKARAKQAETDTQAIALKKRDNGSAGVIRLRSRPGTVSYDVIEQMIREKGFRDSRWNPNGDFPNEYKEQTLQGDNVVIDHATGLMWQQAGSSDTMTWENAQNYVKQRNREHYAGFSDWRLPTIEELASLLEPTKKKGDLYIDPVFDTRQRWCWSADKDAAGASRLAWGVDFSPGTVRYDYMDRDTWVRVVRSRQ